MTIEVEIVGGPQDGRVFALPDNQRAFRFPVMQHPSMLRDDEQQLSIKAIELPIVLTPNGYRIYWNEASC